jgi:uncharacterized protein
MRTGVVEANLVTLNDEYRLPYVEDLVARKSASMEQGTLENAEFGFHRNEDERLVLQLEAAGRESKLPEVPAGRDALNDLLVRVRLAGLH